VNVVRGLLRVLLGRRLPITEGKIDVPGITGTVRIARDSHGVAYVDADNEADAWFGHGFAQGQDRAFQLESILRLVRGTLSELVGADALPLDRLSRRIGFRRSALAQLGALDEDVRTMLEAFAAGVSQGTTVGSSKPAHEFALLRSRPTRYEVADVLGLMKLMPFLLASNWDAELMRYKMITDDGVAAMLALDPTYPEWLPATIPVGKSAGPAIDRLSADLELFTAVTGMGGGSNNWAIAGSRTASGRPIVANDPHLAPSHPSHWHLAHVSTPDWNLAGAALVGAPAFPVGFNGRCAWGVTAGLIDNSDLFIEEIGPDGTSVRVGDEFVACTVHREMINIKGGESVVEEVLETPHGPIIGPALAENEAAVALRATWLDPVPGRGMLGLQTVSTPEELSHAYRHWPSLPINVVSGYDSGDIAWQLAGDTPIRKSGNGTLPAAGWDPAFDWSDELVDIRDLPHAVNPDAGFIATANNRPFGGEGDAFVGYDFIDGYRLARITEKLAEHDNWTLDDVAALQLDRVSIPWREMRDVVLGVAADDPAARIALGLLGGWDGIAGIESIPASVYELFVVDLARRVVRAKAPNTAEWALGKGMDALHPEMGVFTRRTGHLSRLVRQRPEGWFAGGWDAEIAAALTASIRQLTELRGSDTAAWAWGDVHPLTFKHPVGERRPMDKVFNLGPFPWGGDANTVSQAAVSFLDPAANSPFVASMRMAVEVGDWDNNRFVLPGGQSGNPMSPHYADQLDLYRSGGSISIAWSPEAVAAVTVDRLELRRA
jgi:penicillin amidase